MYNHNICWMAISSLQKLSRNCNANKNKSENINHAYTPQVVTNAANHLSGRHVINLRWQSIPMLIYISTKQ